jgi:hypothetical protein
MSLYLLLVLKRVFSDAIKPGVGIVPYSKYLTDLDHDRGSREISYMYLRIFPQNQGVRWHINIIKVSISRENLLHMKTIQAIREVG